MMEFNLRREWSEYKHGISQAKYEYALDRYYSLYHPREEELVGRIDHPDEPLTSFNRKPSWIARTLFPIRYWASILTPWFLSPTFIRSLTICRWHGHNLVDAGSYAGPDSGEENLCCTRCGYTFHHTYY